MDPDRYVQYSAIPRLDSEFILSFRWQSKLFVTASRMILHTGIALGVTLLVIAVVMAVLQYRERVCFLWIDLAALEKCSSLLDGRYSWTKGTIPSIPLRRIVIVFDRCISNSHVQSARCVLFFFSFPTCDSTDPIMSFSTCEFFDIRSDTIVFYLLKMWRF